MASRTVSTYFDLFYFDTEPRKPHMVDQLAERTMPCWIGDHVVGVEVCAQRHHLK